MPDSSLPVPVVPEGIETSDAAQGEHAFIVSNRDGGRLLRLEVSASAVNHDVLDFVEAFAARFHGATVSPEPRLTLL